MYSENKPRGIDYFAFIYGLQKRNEEMNELLEMNGDMADDCTSQIET